MIWLEYMWYDANLNTKIDKCKNIIIHYNNNNYNDDDNDVNNDNDNGYKNKLTICDDDYDDDNNSSLFSQRLLWPWPFAWTSLLSIVITPENFMMIRWEEHTENCMTDELTDRQMELTIHRAAWWQLNIQISVIFYRFTKCINWYFL